jgi:DNA (cytosine-5)-methyltransferase 1
MTRRPVVPLDLLPYVLDYCAGIGGWDVALRRRGLEGAGIERDAWARVARVANGLLTVHDDLTTLPEALVRTPWRGVVGSFPCQPFSQGNYAAMTNPLDDPRARLMHVGLEHLLASRPPFVCLENVGRAAWLMQELADALVAVGYSAEVRVINAADYGLPQARKRALLVARRDGGALEWPAPTHVDQRTRLAQDEALLEDGRKPWVTLAEALPHRDDLPAWAHRHPATTIVGSFEPDKVAPPTYRKPGDGPRQKQPGTVSLTLAERLLVQGFPEGWATAGPDSATGLQVGNAIPPTLAEVALDAAGVMA